MLAMMLVMGIASCASAQSRKLWQIGRFDDSSQEFRNQNVNYIDPKLDAVYTVGISNDKDWIGFQPGPANATAGGRLHPFRINFALNDTPRGLYRLKIAVLYETPRLSSLQVDINGHRGRFYFHPTLDYAAGDWAGTFVPQTSRDEKVIDIPARWLIREKNELVLTAIDNPSVSQASLGDIAPGQSGIVYDAVSLSQEEASPYGEDKIDVLAVPTIFFKQSPGGLEERIDIFTSLNAGIAKKVSKISLRVGGKLLENTFDSAADFGELRAEFNIPEWNGEQAATITIGSRNFVEHLKAAKKWTFDIVPFEHLDIGFTDYAPKVAELQSESIDGVLDILQKHPEFRWTLDGSWVAQQYLAGRSPERRMQFLEAVRSEQISIPAEYANQLTGIASLEDLIRSLYTSHTLALRYHFPIGAAHITDVPSYSWSYASVLHNAGIKYFAAGSNSWRAPAILMGHWNEESPFYWEGPDGGRVMMWYSRAYLQLASMFGTPPTIHAVEDAAPVFLEAYSRPAYRASSVIVFGSQLENTPLSRGQVTLPQEWATHYAWPRFEFTTFEAAMTSIEKQFDGKLPVYRGDFGPYWEDGVTSDAEYTAIFRRNQQRILTAEKMSVLPELLNPALRPDRALLSAAWRNMLLFDEHTWTAAGATTAPESDSTVEQLREKDLKVVDAQNEIAQSIERSWAQMESFLSPSQDSILVFNSLNWMRTGWVECDLPQGEEIFDSRSRSPVPQVILHAEASTPLPGFGGRLNRVRFLAADVPALGYKLLEIGPEKTSHMTLPAQPRNTSILENRYYCVILDPQSGAIRSIFDKDLHRELVDTHSPFRFGVYVYTKGADDMPRNSLYRYGAAQTLPQLLTIPSANGKIVSVVKNVQGTTAVLESSAPETPTIRIEIILPADQKQIDFTYRLHKNRTLRKEAVYIAFPLAAAMPEFNYETQNGWVNPARDELPGGSREWYALNHWAAMTSGGITTALFPEDAPMVTFGDIVRGQWPSDFHPKTGAIFSWLMSNYWDTNYAASQGGDYIFRYVLTSSPKFDPAQLTHLGWDVMTPLESDPVHAAQTEAGLPRNSASLLSADSPAVVMTTWKPAENEDGSIVRLLETSGKVATVTLKSSYLGIQRAWICDALETNERELPVLAGGVKVSIPALSFVTVRLKTEPHLKPPVEQP